MTDHRDLPAGSFSAWLRRVRMAQLGDEGIDVPCAGCDACCRSSYFIHIGPEESGTLTHMPGELLFAAPGLAKGNVLLGYDENGRCPMLGGDGCSIYEHRPATCRTYDCRVFAAAGIAADREPISQRVRRWAFSYPTDDDRREHAAVRAAATFLREHGGCFPGGAVPSSPAQVALLAIKVYSVFLEHPVESRGTGPASRDEEIVRAVAHAREEFEAGRP